MDASKSELIARSRWLAGLLGFFGIGLGQLYNGEGRKSLGILAAIVFVGVSLRSHLIVWFGGPMILMIYVFTLLLVVGSIVEAVYQAHTPRPRRSYNRWYIYVLYVLLFPVLMAGITKLSRSIGTADFFDVPASSMNPALRAGDKVIVNKLSFRVRKPQPGDVAIFLFPKDESINYVKRVVAGPGQTVEFRNGDLWIDGARIPRINLTDNPSNIMDATEAHPAAFQFVRETIGGHEHTVIYDTTSQRDTRYGPVIVPPGKYFVLGDHRDRSADSRIWGMVPEENFVGRPLTIYFSFDPESGEIRWDRMGIPVH